MSDTEPRKVLIIVTADPRRSGRVAEAIRIAAGLRAWNALDVSLYFDGEAIRALAGFPEELEDGETIRRRLPEVVTRSRPAYVQRGAGELKGLSEIDVAAKEIDRGELAHLAAGSQCVMRFG